MPDWARRGIRTLAQASFVNAIIGLLIIFDAIHWTPGQIAAVNAVAVPLLTCLQNLAEDKTNFPAILKANASGGQNPTTRDPAR